MKVAKNLAIALLIVAILASIIWVLRNSIIQRLSGPILSDYGMAVTDVSLDALATENATISYLELEHENGTVIAIEDLTLPIGTASTGMKKYVAENVTIDVPSEDEPKPLLLAELINQLLSLPDALAETEITVSQLNVTPYSTVQDLRWASTESQQEIKASLNAVNLSVEIVAKGEKSFEARFSLKQTSLNAPEQSITTDIRQSDSGYRLSGATMLGLPTTVMIARSIAASFGATLAGVEFASGAALFEFSASLPYDTNQPASVIAYLRPSAPFELAFSVKSGVVNVVSVRSAGPVKLEVTYPKFQWSISEEQASLSMSYDELNDITASIADLNCTNGPNCIMNLDVSMDDADLTFATANRFELSAFQDVVFADDGIQLLIHPDAELAVTGMSVSDTKLAGLNAVLMSAASLQLSDNGWAFAAESLDADVESLSLAQDFKFSTPLSLRNLSIGDLDQPLSMNVLVDSVSSQLTWDGRTIAIPGFNGNVSLQDDGVLAELTTDGLHNEANIRAEHDLGTDSGRISIDGASLSFDARKLSGRISPWTDDWDITAGILSADLQMNWQQRESAWQLDGRSALSAADLAGSYLDTAFAGLSTGFEAEFQAASGLIIEPAHIEVDLLEVGLPIENITADYTLNPDALSVDVEDLRMHAFGGVVKADPFSYELESDRNSLMLRAESIELTELLTLKEFEAIELSGSIGAELPVIIEGDDVSILDGTLTGEAPGGVIRYRPDIIPDDTGTPGIGLVTRALSNFQYETLTSTVSYSKDGDLVLQMTLAGRNPDLEDNRPVVLNLGVENNIPKMLRSLQAARAVEEILEKAIEK